VYAGGDEVTSQFALRDDGRYQGLVTGVEVGKTTLRATAPGHIGKVRVTNQGVTSGLAARP